MVDSSSHHLPPFLLFVFIVLIGHLGLLGFGMFWSPASPPPKTRAKVVVQTIQLKPMQTTPVQNVPAPSQTMASSDLNPPTEQLKPEPLPPLVPLVKEDIPLKQEVVLQQEVALQTEISPLPTSKKEEIPPPKPSAPKIVQESPKITPAKKPVLVKKPVESTKKAAPVKKVVEPAKKSVKHETTKAQSTKELDKKKEQERVVAEKKRQQEKEAEKKRQQELAVQEVERQRQQALLNKAKENLAKIGETRDKISISPPSVSLEATSLPKEVGSLQVDALPMGETGSLGDWGTKEISYSGEVATRLKMALKLPDYGAVKIKLTLDRTGKVLKVETVQSESNKNKTYVENKILTLVFPSFGQRFQSVAQNTFVITLQND